MKAVALARDGTAVARRGARVLVVSSALLWHLLATHCIAGDATFSSDGIRIYAIIEADNQQILREINLKDQTTRTIPLKLPPKDPLLGISRSGGNELICVTEKSLWKFDPRTGQLTKVRDALKGGRFWRIAYDPKSRTAFVTASGEGGPLFMLKNGRELTSIYVRRNDAISSPVFSSSGELFYSEAGDLWSGEIEKEDADMGGRFYLSAERYAPLAWLETNNGTPSQTGVSDIAVAREAIYAQLFRMGGSGWGAMVQLPRVHQQAEPEQVSGMGEIALKNLAKYKEILQGLKPLGTNDRPACLCASPDETRVYYSESNADGSDEKDYLITNGQTQELHLTKSTTSSQVAASQPPLATSSPSFAPPGQISQAPPPTEQDSQSSPGASVSNQGSEGASPDQSATAEKMVQAFSDGDVETLISLYADSVDYLDKGRISSDEVRGQLQEYFAKWPKRQWKITGTIQTAWGATVAPSRQRVTFTATYDVSSSKTGRHLSGTAKETLTLAPDSSGAMKITSQREQTTNNSSRERTSKSNDRGYPRERVYDARPVVPNVPWPPGIPHP